MTSRSMAMPNRGISAILPPNVPLARHASSLPGVARIRLSAISVYCRAVGPVA
jgi:hypothetical protein